MTIYQGLESLQTFWFVSEHDTWWDLGPFEDKQAGLVQSIERKAKPPEKQLKLELAKAESILLWHSTVQNLSNGIDSWLEQPSVMATLECPQDLARSNWKVEFISQIELQILWLGSWQIDVSTDTWLWQSAPCQASYPSVSVATQELSESVLLAVSIERKGILLLSQRHCIRILHSHRRPVIQYNVGQTWGLLTAPLSEFANACSRSIWVHFT